MTKFKYTGTIPWSASIRHQKDEKWAVLDVNMSKDDEAELPEETATVKWMVSSGALVPVDVDPKSVIKTTEK